MLEPKKGDIVFHYFVYLSTKEVNIIKSYSRIVDSFYEATTQDELCQYSPPYRKIELESNTQLNTKVTINPPTLGTEELAMDNFIDGISHHDQTLLYANQTTRGRFYTHK